MKSPKPPAVATWLLEHAVVGEKNEALAGDLSEELPRRRSAAWYWRQVFNAILIAFIRFLLTQWWAALYALGWTIFIAEFWPRIWFSPPLQSLLGWGINHDWPASIIYGIATYTALITVIIWLALSFLVLLTRRFKLRAFFRGLLSGLVMAVVFNVTELLLPWTARATAGWLPFFVAVLVSVAVMQSGATDLRRCRPEQ